jgi:ABC-type Zn uptake system ZnuABC Zn-binding protein ZnuA
MHTENAIKVIKKAVPTVNEDGNVIKWNIDVEYSLNDYVSKYSRVVDVDPSKVPSDYSKAELWDLAKESHLNQVFESQYVSVKLAETSTVETISDFDVDSLI